MMKRLLILLLLCSTAYGQKWDSTKTSDTPNQGRIKFNDGIANYVAGKRVDTTGLSALTRPIMVLQGDTMWVVKNGIIVGADSSYLTYMATSDSIGKADIRYSASSGGPIFKLGNTSQDQVFFYMPVADSGVQRINYDFIGQDRGQFDFSLFRHTKTTGQAALRIKAADSSDVDKAILYSTGHATFDSAVTTPRVRIGAVGDAYPSYAKLSVLGDSSVVNVYDTVYQGAYGLGMSKDGTDSTNSIGINYGIDGTPKWGHGIDVKNPYYYLMFDWSMGKDVLTIAPGSKMQLGPGVGDPVSSAAEFSIYTYDQAGDSNYAIDPLRGYSKANGTYGSRMYNSSAGNAAGAMMSLEADTNNFSIIAYGSGHATKAKEIWLQGYYPASPIVLGTYGERALEVTNYTRARGGLSIGGATTLIDSAKVVADTLKFYVGGVAYKAIK
jgi:hypothetical protein